MACDSRHADIVPVDVLEEYLGVPSSQCAGLRKMTPPRRVSKDKQRKQKRLKLSAYFAGRCMSLSHGGASAKSQQTQLRNLQPHECIKIHESFWTQQLILYLKAN